MTQADLLQLIYSLERPFLQANDWAGLRLPVTEIVNAAAPTATAAEVVGLLRSLRLDGKIMFLPAWERWGIDEDQSDGQLLDSPRQWEPALGSPDPPSWIRRRVFIPNELKGWFVRSRVAETARLLFANRERFGLEASTAHLNYELQMRLRPDRNARPIPEVVSRLCELVTNGEFPRAADRPRLTSAIQVVGQALALPSIAAFQERAWESILRCLFGQPRATDAVMITAGVSSGKTYAFLLPALTLLVYRALCGEGHRNRVLVIYPRTSLVEDQYHNLRRVLASINAILSSACAGTSLTDRPALDAGQMLGDSLGGGTTSLADTLPRVGTLGIEVILTTPESLKNRMLDPRAVSTYLRNVEMIVFDEIHLMEGLAGCHGIYFIRRLRQLIRDLRHDSSFEPAWVGASATVAEPVEHCARVLSLSATRVTHIAPATTDLIAFGVFHHLFLHTRAGKASISAVTNGISCLVHTRNDCTAFSHYVDPAGPTLQRRNSDEVLKTLVFVDSLSTIGRLHFTTADNERTYDPADLAPPYYSWFYRPASRFNATAGEVKAIGERRLQEIREWCRRCYHGIPERLDSAGLKAPEFGYLRTNLRMDDKAQRRATPPGFPQLLSSLPASIGNLDECPFHKARLCWWFSQDDGGRRSIGQNSIPIDQNRAIAYTSKTVDDVGLHQNVNDYFLTPARALWQRATGMPNRDELSSTLLASPRIEVGVDFRNVRDGATHKALRSAASFQQKVGRVGREDGSDSVIVTFLARRPTDAHFAHHPARLIDAAHLDPIPLKSENPDILRNHMFAAILEYIASRAAGVIADAGNELNIIGTGSGSVPDSWEAKVHACISHLTARRAVVRSFVLAATATPPAFAAVADEAIDTALQLLQIFVTDLDGAYSAGATPAHWFKQNQPAVPTTDFIALTDELRGLGEELRKASIGLPESLRNAVASVVNEVAQESPVPSNLQASAAALMTAVTAALPAGLEPMVAGALLLASGRATAVANQLATLSLSAPLRQVRQAHEIVQAFFAVQDPDRRRMEQYYLHDILTRLVPFRDFYPFGLARTHFQHVNARQVRVLLPGDEEDVESLSAALYELLPGTWTYRWLSPRKSPCGPINQLAGTGEHFATLSTLETTHGTAFEPTGTALSGSDLPADMPAIGSDANVPILRPVRLRLIRSPHRPDARFDNQLVGDDDESPRIADPKLKRDCPTLPRAFPAIWYRVAEGGPSAVVRGMADPLHPTTKLPHTFPAIGRALFERVTFTNNLRVDRYAYAIDRTYGTGAVESPRIYYRHGVPPRPVVLGDTLGQTDGLTFHLRQDTLDVILNLVMAAPSRLQGEMTVRALQRFISRSAAAGPFQSEMIRKAVLMEYLNRGGNLAGLGADVVRNILESLTQSEYDAIAVRLVDGLCAGADPAEVNETRTRHLRWYAEAWPAFQAVRAACSNFTSSFVRDITKDVLIHSLAVVTLDALARLVGAGNGDLAYFHSAHDDSFYIFDSVEGGNGCAETISRFLHIPPLQRLLAARGGGDATLPTTDGFRLIEETLAMCPAQAATRLLFAASERAITNPDDLVFPPNIAADLQARIRHEYDSVIGAFRSMNRLRTNLPGVFFDWHDLIWLQTVPERFAPDLVTSGLAHNIEDLRSKTHACVTGCLECVDNGEESVYGALTSQEHVSKNLLDAVRQHIVLTDASAFVQVAASASVTAAIQANAGQPVTGPGGAPVSVTIDDQGDQRQVLLMKVLSTIAPDFGLLTGGELLAPRTPNPGWNVQVPFLISYRDETPIP